MKIEILNIAGATTPEAAEAAGARLKALPGVQHVSFFDAPASLHARVDETAPTRAELVAVLEQAGMKIEAERPRHAGGGCCGGCGS